MDALKELTRLAARLWYSDTQVVAIDLLTQCPMMSEEELVFKMKMNVRDVRHVLGPLRLDRFIKVDSKAETRKFDNRQIHRMFYYIDYKTVYDSLKYKIWKMQKHYRDRSQVEHNERNYMCPKCNMKFTQLEATLHVYGPSHLFRCPYHRPEEAHYLHLETETQNQSHATLTRFMHHADPLLQRLKQSESIRVPTFDAKAALAEAVVARTAPRGAAGGIRDLALVEEEEERRVEVDIMAMTSVSAEQKAREEAEKERKRKQNALPAWHQKSTIQSGEGMGAAGGKEGKESKPQEEALIQEEDSGPGMPIKVGASASAGEREKVEEEDESANIMEYYATYYNSYQKTKDKDDSEGDDVDEDEEFIDVAMDADGQQKGHVGGMKRRLSDLEGGPGSGDEEGHDRNGQSKRLHVDHGTKEAPNKTQKAAKQEEDSDEEEDDFIDVEFE